MNWTSGYVSDIEYTAGFYAEQSPILLNFVAVLNGYAPVQGDREFTYFELGFGRGVTINLLAANNPRGKFFAADFNPAHVAGASEMAEKAQLDNLVLLERSFDELAAGKVDLPQFDYITLHGIYTWVDSVNRSHITDFIGRYLKPGGIVYVSYNALPGWAASMPLQRLLVEFGNAHPNRSDVQIEQGARFMQQLAEAQGAYFSSAGPALQQRLDGLSNLNRNYLVHEYMHRHWQPMYHADVARDMGTAKLDYAGSADLTLRYPRLFLSDENLALAGQFSDPAMQETLKDYCLNTCFRKDVYIRGARRLVPAQRQLMLHEFGLALTMPRDYVQLTMKLSQGEIAAKPAIAELLLDALAQGPQTFGQLMQLPGFDAYTLEDLVQLATLFVMSRQAALFHGSYRGRECASALRMNVEIAGTTRFSDEYHALCTGLTGGALDLPFLARIAYWLIVGQGVAAQPPALAEAAAVLMNNRGQRMLHQGTPIADDAENLEELNKAMHAVVDLHLPLWHQLGMMPGPVT